MIGIFGGTFDPVHYGHLRPALELLQDLALEQVILIPCRQPPHRNVPAASPELRLRMLQAAVQGVDGFRIDERELGRAGPSYMVDTLSSLREEVGERRLCLLLGMDAFLEFTAWHEWQRILELAHLVVAHRPGWSPPADGELAGLVRQRATDQVRDLKRRRAGLILFRPVTQLGISATGIRDLVAAGKSPRFLLPDSVQEIIEAEGLYRHG